MKVQRLMIPGPAGPLEGLLEWEPQAPEPAAVTLVCHPHPEYGGTMHNKVVFRAAKASLQAGFPTLRFNFRGVGKSQGSYDGGPGEQDDVRAALDYLVLRYPGRPVCLIGFSFGAWVGLATGVSDPRVHALVGLGVPVGVQDLSFLRQTRKPKLLVQGSRDQFGPREQMESFYASLPEPKRLHFVEGADHFFTGKLDEVQTVIREFVAGVLASHRSE